MALKGLTYRAEGINTLKGVRIFLEGITSVVITDGRGKRQAEVVVAATNPVAGVPFQTITPTNGSTVVQAEDPSTISAQKELLKFSLPHNGEATHKLIVDLPILD